MGVYAHSDLFPYGRGDPFGFGKNSESVTLAQKLEHLMRYCHTDSNGIRSYPFQQSTRFGLWAHNIKYRLMLNEQGKVYLRKNPNDANLTIDDLKAKIVEGGHNSVIKNLQR